ncbi:ribosome small subunit-dependent GTPase A [Legionella waltersii]|uniref:Small ribosomal subunit biogenesis GTPase RsgA n=1 Tax=Legionella waltersii TaxID=66969 RepID=A0A0W1ADE0_9GAMM|nr:ribosome small subunit-dependent GTPase A [Legionella waltersii]KTD79345.1 EngC GTPase [Legionella waltersii]SNV13146.1 EngC GTPase [Legionella waltersii]
MSKRRINKQQSVRIAKIQRTYHQEVQKNDSSLNDGLVITRFSRHAEIEDPSGNTLLCTIRPNLESVVAGDKVIWQLEGENQGVVVSLYPRTSVLARPSSRGIKKPVAANITQLIVVMAPKPEVSWPLLDSYLIMADILNLAVVIVLNKVDLPSTDIKERLDSDYRSLGYSIVLTSQELTKSIVELQEHLKNHVSVFVGQSGVGKSSIISLILPHEEKIAINQISDFSELGKHTTRNSRYYHLPTGGALIDSPGVREFILWEIDQNRIAQGYREFKPLISQCKFRNCTHVDTPNCAIINALHHGEISSTRYDNFLKLCSWIPKTTSF